MYTLPLLLALTACEKKLPNYGMSVKTANQTLVGEWKDPSGAVVIIGRASGGATVTSVVDYDGEIFTVLRSGWEGSEFSWTYEVPSTEYLVTARAQEISDEVVMFAWNNTAPDGTTNEGVDHMSRQ